MGGYDDLVALLEHHHLAQKLTKLTENEIVDLVEMYPEAPKDYIDYLREVGYGDIGDGYYMIYSGLITPDSIFDAETAKELEELLLFGDDFSGYCGCFLTTEDWTLIEEDGSCEFYEPEMTFEGFIREKITDYVAIIAAKG
jgi:hypothetical protein